MKTTTLLIMAAGIGSRFGTGIKQLEMCIRDRDKAVTYIQNRRSYLSTYLEDGRCSFSNNLSENAIRPFTVCLLYTSIFKKTKSVDAVYKYYYVSDIEPFETGIFCDSST